MATKAPPKKRRRASTAPLLSPPVDPRIVPDIDFDSVLLDGRDLRVQVVGGIETAKVTRTIEAGSTVELVVRDSDLDLLTSGLLHHETRLTFDGGYRFVLASVQKPQGARDLTLTFEDELVVKLKEAKGYRKAVRDNTTRAEFIYGLLREIKTTPYQFYCPELHKTQPVAGVAGVTAPARGVAARKPSVGKPPPTGPDPGLGAALKWDAEGRASWFGDDPSMGANDKMAGSVTASGVHTTTALVSLYQQSTLKGWWVLRAPNGKTLAIQQLDIGPAPWTGKTFDLTPKAAKAFGYWPNFPTGVGTWHGHYVGKTASDRARAVQLAGAVASGAASISGNDVSITTTQIQAYTFERKPGESSWVCIQRLAQEVGWRFYVVGQWAYFISEHDLMNQQPRLTMNDDQPGVEIGFEYDRGQRVAEAQVSCSADLWAAPPGTLAKLEGLGPADGGWLVSEIDRDLFFSATQITLKQPAPELPEPAPQTTTTTSTSSVPVAAGLTTNALGNLSKGGLVTFDGKQVAAWIGPILAYGRQHGWHGSVTSGYRSYADQLRIWNSGVRPAARPGTSNHEGITYPRGAVDVTDAQTLSNILLRSPYRTTLVWAGAKDPVHLSHPHGGSY